MDEFLNAVLKAIDDAGLSLTAPIEIGQLPPEEGASVEFGPSNNRTTFLNKCKEDNIVLLFLRKSQNQLVCIKELDAIGEYLSKLKTYPQPTSGPIRWVNTEVTTPAGYVDKEDNGSYIYSMIISNKITR
jgi:hypothetical protein